LFVVPPPDGFIIADESHGNMSPVGGREAIFFYTLHNQPESGKLQTHSTAFPITDGKSVYASTNRNLRKEYTVADFRAAIMRIVVGKVLIEAGVPTDQVANMSDGELIQEIAKRLPRPPWEKWTFAELSKHADTIVIARFTSSTEFPFDISKFPLQANDEEFRRRTGPTDLGVVSEFSVQAVLRGEVNGDELEVVHLKLGPNFVNLSDIRFAQFEKEVIVPATTSVVLEGQPSEVSAGPMRTAVAPNYLLFLIRRSDGRFEAASGQLHSAYSVRTVEGGFESWGFGGVPAPRPSR
jgi:hypothetical protein